MTNTKNDHTVDLTALGITAEQAYALGGFTADLIQRAAHAAEQRTWTKAGDVLRRLADRLRTKSKEVTEPQDSKHWRAVAAGVQMAVIKLTEVADAAAMTGPPNPDEAAPAVPDSFREAVELHRPVMYDQYYRVTDDPEKATAYRCDECAQSVTKDGCRTWRTAHPTPAAE